MKRISIILLLALTFAGTYAAHAQGFRVGDRAWYTVRGGLFIGANQSFHNGNVPLLPSAENGFYADGNTTNFLFGVQGEKSVTRYVVFGLRLAFNQMSGDVEGRFTDPFRVADPDDPTIVSEVVRDQTVDYTLQYLTFGVYTKLYPMSGPGLFVSGGLNVGTLIKDNFSHEATLVEPEWASGSIAPPQEGEIEDVNGMRYAASVGLGYDFFFRYGFLTPQLIYEFGLTNVIDAPYADTWRIDNVRFVLDLNFPVP
ncbi:PorT family protein [bacterium]|nr:PorT family protein [bacterium]